MTAWTTISNLLVAVGAKPFATTIQALRDNPVAIAEGASGAPRVQCAAFAGIAGGGRIDHSGTTGVTVLLPFVSTWLAIDFWTELATNGQLIRFRASSDAGATWGAHSTIHQAAANTTVAHGRLFLNRVTGAFDIRGAASTGSPSVFRTTGTLAVAAGMNALEFSCTTNTGSHVGRHFVQYVGEAT